MRKLLRTCKDRWYNLKYIHNGWPTPPFKSQSYIDPLAAYMLIVKNGGWRAWPCVDVDGGSVLLVVNGHCLLDIAAIGAWGEDVKNLDGQQRQSKFSINSVHWKSSSFTRINLHWTAGKPLRLVLSQSGKLRPLVYYVTCERTKVMSLQGKQDSARFSVVGYAVQWVTLCSGLRCEGIVGRNR